MVKPKLSALGILLTLWVSAYGHHPCETKGTLKARQVSAWAGVLGWFRQEGSVPPTRATVGESPRDDTDSYRGATNVQKTRDDKGRSRATGGESPRDGQKAHLEAKHKLS